MKNNKLITIDQSVSLEWDKFKIAYHNKREALFKKAGNPGNLTSLVHSDLAHCYSSALFSKFQGSAFNIAYAGSLLTEIKEN